VCLLVESYLREGRPPEAAVVAFKRCLAHAPWSAAHPYPDREQLVPRMVTWCIEHYFSPRERRAAEGERPTV
jgi:hypothetical protein